MLKKGDDNMTLDEITNVKKKIKNSKLYYSAQSNDYDITIIYDSPDVPYDELSTEKQCTSKDINLTVSLRDKKHPVKFNGTLYNKMASIIAELSDDKVNISNYKTQIPAYEKMYHDIEWIIDNIVYDIIPKEYINDSNTQSVEMPEWMIEALNNL